MVAVNVSLVHALRSFELFLKDSILELRMGGGAGYGPPAERSKEAVLRDVEDGVHNGGSC